MTIAAPVILAAEAPEIAMIHQTEEAVRGKKYRVAIRFHNNAEALISAFRLQVTYDEDYLTLTDVEGPEGTGAADFRSSNGETKATAVFASFDHPVSLSDGVCCTLVFSVKEDAAVGSTAVTAAMDQLVDKDLHPIEGVCTARTTIAMSRLLSADAQLRSLVPSFGSLTPAFSPDVTEYTLSVPYEVKQLTFTAVPENGASYRVNRKNLNAAGTPTTYIVKVTSENKQTVTEYVITATRKEKAGSTAAGKADSITADKSADADEEVTITVPEGSNAEKTTNDGMTFYGNRTIYYINSQFTVFVLGLSAAGICALLIILICAKRKNKVKSDDDYRPKH